MYAWLIKKKNDFRYDLSGVRTSGRPIGSIMSAQPLVWDSQEQVSGESISDVDDQTQPPANVSSTPLSPSLLAGVVVIILLTITPLLLLLLPPKCWYS